jgi:hypothetical protein
MTAMKTNSAQIIYEPQLDVYKLEFGYYYKNSAHNLFLDMLKKNVPASDREFNPVTKVWMFQPKHYNFISLLVDATFRPVYRYTKEQYEDSVRGSAQANVITTKEYKNRFNKIMQELGKSTFIKDETTYSEAAKIYRHIAMELHPDRNPNGAEFMSRINECWASIKLDYQEKEQLCQQ